MSFIVNKRFYKWISFLVGFVPVASTPYFIKYFYPRNIKISNFDINMVEDENVNKIEFLIDKDSPVYKAHKSIQQWTKEKGNCSVRFSIPGQKNVWVGLDDSIFKNPDASPILKPEKELGQKSKFERFAEMIASKKSEHSLYVFFTEAQCGGGKLNLYWRESPKGGISAMFGDIKNLWLDNNLFSK